MVPVPRWVTKSQTIRFFNLKEQAKRQNHDTVVILQSTLMNDHHFQIPNPEQAHGKIQLDFIVCLLADAGVTRWMVSPGSRNAPLVASMVKHGGFDLHSFPDERVAAFAALGAAQGPRYPVGVICTSGTAAANLYPAVCEAFYQRIPLLILTADRPPELIDQWDGQTIHQNNLFQPHTQGNFNLPVIAPTQDLSSALLSLQTTVQAAIAQTLYPVPGPVHINVPLRDPIYADVEKPFQHIAPTKPFLIHHPTPPPVDQTLAEQWMSHTNVQQPRILIVVGMHHPQPELSLALESLQNRLPILTDIVSQQHPFGLQQWDLAMLNHTPNHSDFRPDVLITLGMGVVSKPLKQWLKANKPQKHIHISPLQDLQTRSCGGSADCETDFACAHAFGGGIERGALAARIFTAQAQFDAGARAVDGGKAPTAQRKAENRLGKLPRMPRKKEGATCADARRLHIGPVGKRAEQRGVQLRTSA